MASPNYPPTGRVEHVDDYHGTKVPDPYRWLEQPSDTPEVRGWVEAQNEVTYRFLEGIASRDAIRGRLTQLWNYPKRSAPFKKGRRYFEFRNSGLQNQNVLYVLDSPRDEGRLLLDPNTFSEDGTVALTSYAVSRDGRYLAYATSAGGSDWLTWRVRDIPTGEDLSDTLEWSKFTQAAWLPDASGFYYKRYPTPEPGAAYTGTNENAELLLHRLGTTQEQDEVIYKRPDQPKWSFHPRVSHDARYLVLAVTRSTEARNLVFYKALGGDAAFTELIPDFEAEYLFLGNDGPVFYFQTDMDALKGRIVAIDTRQPERANWRTVVAEREDTLEHAQMVGDAFFTVYMKDASHRLERIDLSGTATPIDLPTLGSIAELNGERDQDEVFYSFTSFLYPTTSYRYDLATGTSEQLHAPALDFDPEPYVTRQLFATSKDGTRVPVFVVHRKDLALDGRNPTLLYGYGGFNISLTPGFSVGRLAWLELGGVLAVANLRGGGEYGKDWHEAGSVHQRQNVFDDFIACAEHLIREKITSPDKLAIQGGSNGGLLVGACMTQRPELFAAALPAVGVMDMLRFHRFTIGWGWVSDYGSSDDPEEFKTLLAYSPLHNLVPGTAYPATLITTGDHDDRVVPSHSFKFAAALQHAQAGDAPVLIRIQTKAGHGMGKPTAMLIEEQTDIWAFLVEVLGMEAYRD